MSVKERLRAFIKYKKISERNFCMTAGLALSYVNNIRVSIQPDKITSISLAFPELNTGWLLTGVGEMLLPMPKAYTPLAGDENMLNYLLEENTEYRKTIGIQAESINKMQDQIQTLQRKLNEKELDEKGNASAAPGVDAACANAG